MGRNPPLYGTQSSREGVGRWPAMTQRFPYAIDPWYLPLILPFGLKPKTDGVQLTDDGRFVATFGFFTTPTPLANITDAHTARNSRGWRASAGRGSMADDGLSFGTN